jgi:glycyl-tRNA synthetase alpha subunit
VTERASRIARVRNLARAVAQVYLELEEGADADAAA